MNARLAAFLTLFIGFTAYSAFVVANHGYTGFIELALADVWGGQLLLDLTISLLLFSSWMLGDARARGIAWAPYLVLIVTLGSVGALAYLIHREIKTVRENGPQGHSSRQLQSS